MIAGPTLPCSTVKPALRVTTSEPVVRVTLCAPKKAAGSMSSTAVALVDELTVSNATVTPGPKFAVVIPATKCVNCPVIPTSRFCCPCWPEFGLTKVSWAIPAVMVKPFASDATSVPVVSVTVCAPVTAVGLILIVAVAVVAEPTVNETTVMPAANDAVVVP